MRKTQTASAAERIFHHQEREESLKEIAGKDPGAGQPRETWLEPRGAIRAHHLALATIFSHFARRSIPQLMEMRALPRGEHAANRRDIKEIDRQSFRFYAIESYERFECFVRR